MVIPKLLIIHLVSKNFFYLGIISFGLVQSVLGFAQAPSNGQVSAGTASISQQANQTTINQTSPKAIIDWRSFSIGADNRVVFVQPNSSSITLNRVTGKEASVINGSLLANGHVWLLNSNGILIGKTGQVSVGSFLGSTQSLANEKFLAGDYRFSPNPNSGSLISNQGKIIVKDGGYAILSGEAVRNDGYIQAHLGQVVLAGSKSFAIDLSGDRMISFAVTEPLEMIPADGRAVVDNTGTLRADGGQVLLTARSASQLIGQVINTSGLISAASASLVNGSIVLDGGTNGGVTVSGSLDASGKNAQEKGGAIDVMGQHLSLTSSAALDVSGDLGGGIIQIGGSWQGAANQYSQAVTNTIALGAVLNASAITKGDGGSIVAWSDVSNPLSVTQVGGNLLATGGLLGGNGGAIETSGRLLDINGIRVSTKSPLGKTGNWLIDPVDTVIQLDSQPNTVTTTYISSSTLLSSLATTNYILSSSSGGNINVNADLTSASANTVTLIASGLLNVNSNLNLTGNLTLTSTGGGVSLGSGTTIITNNLTVNGSLTGTGNIAFRSGVNGDLLISQTFVTPTTYSGNITGNGKLTKSGLGSLTLTGSNTFTGGILISEGTLIGNTLSLLGNVVNNGNLIFNQSNAGTFAGNISGTGYVGKDGQGVLTLSGVNNYSNGTQIANGTIVGNTQSLIGNILNNAALIFDQSDTGQFAGNISGSGSVTKLGQGNLTLTGTNSYTGGTTVSTASLIGNTQSLTGNIVDNATVIFDQATNGTFAGNISGTGVLLKLGAGSLTLSGRNSYTGGTTITTGTLIGNSQSLTGNIVDNAFLTFDQSNTAVIQSNDAVFAGRISGTGAFTKQGSSSLTLTGENNYQGGTTISAGTLIGNSQSLTGNILNNGALTFDQSGTGQFAGNISGTGALLKLGAGSLTLSGRNSYTGGTTITTGTLIGSSQSLTGNIVDNAFLTFDQSSDAVFAGRISGSGALTKQGSGSLTLSGENNYQGGTTISAGALIGNTQSLIGNIVDNATVIFDQATNGTFAGNISGTGALLKLGAGSLTLSGRNSYTGGTTITTGTLIGNSQSLTGNIVDNAFLTFDQSNTAVIQSNDAVFAGRISGTGAFTKQGSSSLTLTGENNYQGGTTISAGTLIGNSQSLTGNILNNGALTFDQSGTGQFAGNISGTGALLKLGAGSLTLSGRNSYTGGTTITTGTLIGSSQSLTGNIVDNAFLTFDQSSDAVFAGRISGSGALTKQGSGSLTLSGENNYQGGTTISAGALIGNTQSLIGNIVDNATVIFDQATNGTFAGNISGTGALLKLGAGSLTLSGRNSYTGGTTITTGTLIGNSQSLTGNIVDNAFLTFDQSNTAVIQSNDAVFAGRISGTGAFTKQGSSSLTLTGENNYQGGTTISAGTLIGNSQSLTGNILNNGALTFDQSGTGQFAGNISGTGALLKLGAGSLTLSGRNSYTGGTTITTGTLIGSSQSLTGNIVDNAFLTFDQSSDAVFAGRISGSGALTKQGSGSLTLSGENNYQGGTTISAGALIGNTQSLIGNIVDNASLIFDQSSTGTFAGSISGSGTVQSRGQGSLTLSGVNTYGGGTTISAGTLIGNAQSLTGNMINNATLIFEQSNTGTFAGSISGTGALLKLGAGSLTLSGRNSYTGGTTITTGTLIGSSQSLTGNIVDNAFLTFDQSSDAVFAGRISGSGALTKQGSGSLTLSGENNYQGGTTISAGALIGNTQSLIGNIVDNASLIFDQSTDATFSGNISGSGNVIKNNAGKLILAGLNTFTGGTITNAGQLQLGLSTTSDNTAPTTSSASLVPTNFNPAALNFKLPPPMQFAPPPTTSFAGPSGPQVLNPNSAGLPPPQAQGSTGGQGVAENPGPGPGGGNAPAGSNPAPNAPPVGGAFVASFTDAGPPPPPSGPNQPSTTGQGPVAQGVESASPAAPPPPPPPLTAKATPSDTPAAGDASLKVTAVVPTYTPPKQNARQTSRVSTTIVANGLALQKTQNIASSSTPVLNNNLSIRGNSANW